MAEHEADERKDVFISYASEDRGIVLALSEQLERSGFGVWWDARLVPGDEFGGLIEDRIRSSLAVIVVWTPASVVSRWVKAEVQIAFNANKLLPVKSRNLSYEQLPAPYNILHACSVEDLQAVVAALATLNVFPSPDRANTRRVKDGDGLPLLISIPRGQFLMGSPESEKGRGPEEGPQHRVVISTRLWVGVFPITFAEWDFYASVCRNAAYLPDDEGWGRDLLPVMNVSWHDCQKYISWIKEITGLSYRLLGENEWEYCCRAGRLTPYSVGDQIKPDQARYSASAFASSNRTSNPGTTQVGQFGPNQFGLTDMHGNVWEWVQDTWCASYSSQSDSKEIRKVVRGGSWIDGPERLRSAARTAAPRNLRSSSVGFRICREDG